MIILYGVEHGCVFAVDVRRRRADIRELSWRMIAPDNDIFHRVGRYLQSRGDLCLGTIVI